MITPTDMLEIVSAGMELLKVQQPTLPHNVSRVFVPFLKQHGTIKNVRGTHLDIMLDNGTFIQTSMQSLQKYTIKEESDDFPLNKSLGSDSHKLKQLQLF